MCSLKKKSPAVCCWNRPERERERGIVLSRDGWSVLAASKEEAKREKDGQVCPARKACVEESFSDEDITIFSEEELLRCYVSSSLGSKENK